MPQNTSQVVQTIAPIYSQETISRFWCFVDKCNGKCWEWCGTRFSTGYGLFRPIAGRAGTVIGAHRFAMEVRLGRKLNKAEQVLHTCDNPPCCNPDHLYVGSHIDNMRDRKSRNRESRGDRHSQAIKRSPGVASLKGQGNHQSKLTELDIIEMRRLFDNGIKNRNQLADIYKVHHKTVTGIVYRHFWKHLP